MFFYPLQKNSLYVIGMAMTFNCTGTRIAVQIGVRFNITGWLSEGATSVVLSRKKICVSGKIIIWGAVSVRSQARKSLLEPKFKPEYMMIMSQNVEI